VTYSNKCYLLREECNTKTRIGAVPGECEKVAFQPPTETEGGQGSADNPGPSPSDADANKKTLADRAKKGQCPADRVGRRYHSDKTCDNDDGCPGDKMCCSRGRAKVCRTPDVPKAGKCPTNKKTKYGKDVVSKCDADLECCDAQKCCESDIGAFECMDPAK